MWQESYAYYDASGACGKSHKGNFTPKKSKLDNSADVYQNFSSDSLKPKRINMHHKEPKIVAKK